MKEVNTDARLVSNTQNNPYKQTKDEFGEQGLTTQLHLFITTRTPLVASTVMKKG